MTSPNRTGHIIVSRGEVEALINAINSNNGAKQHAAVIFLKKLLEGEEV